MAKFAKSKMVLLRQSKDASRILLPKIESDLRDASARVEDIVMTISHQSSTEVAQAAGPVAMFAKLAVVFSSHFSLKPKLDEVEAQLTKAIADFKVAARAEGGLR